MLTNFRRNAHRDGSGLSLIGVSRRGGGIGTLLAAVALFLGLVALASSSPSGSREESKQVASKHCSRARVGTIHAVDCRHPAGPRGRRGVPGRMGDVGPVGPQGPLGLTGPQGAAGLQGLLGAKGDTGLKGDACLPSDPACKGPKGDKGDPGGQGHQGNPGTNGTDGTNGKDGKDGNPGPPAASILTARSAVMSSGPEGFLPASGNQALSSTESAVTILTPAKASVGSALVVDESVAGSNDDTRVYTLRVNGSDTALTCSMLSAQTQCENITANVNIPPASKVSYSRQVIAGTGGGVDAPQVLIAWRATT